MDAGTMRKRLHEVEVLVRDVRSSVRDDGTLDETLLKQQIVSLELVLRFARRSRKLARLGNSANSRASVQGANPNRAFWRPTRARGGSGLGGRRREGRGRVRARPEGGG